MLLFYILSFQQHCKRYVKYLISECISNVSRTRINLIIGKYQHFFKHTIAYEQGK